MGLRNSPLQALLSSLGQTTNCGPRILPTEMGFGVQTPQPNPAPLQLPSLPGLSPYFISPILPTSTASPAPRGVGVEGQLGVVFCLCARIPFRVQEGGTS